MNHSISRALIIIAILATAAATGVAEAQTPSCDPGVVYNCFLVRANYGLQQSIAQRNGLVLLGEVTPGKPDLVLATGPSSLLPETTLANLESDPDVVHAELNSLALLPEVGGNANSGSSASGVVSQGNYNGPETAYFTTQVWKGYGEQTALANVSMPPTHALANPEAMGAGVVAIIDTGVDPNHELLNGALTLGYDFILDQPGASEWNAIPAGTRLSVEANLKAAADQSYTVIVDGGATTDPTHPSLQPIVDQSYTVIVDDNNLPAAFGHGTAVAGVVRITAPAAQIMALRAFDGDGVGDLARIIDAIYYAADNGANVLNMSFSIDQSSKELYRAIKYAKRKGVVMVSSAGNAGTNTLTYPAAYGEVVGVAANDAARNRSTFSNWGIDLVHLAAPGEEIITLYPGDLYGAAWGTSFSAPFVAGQAALMHDIKSNGSLATITLADFESAITAGVDPDPNNSQGEIGYGKLNAHNVFQCGPHGDATLCPN